MPSIRQELRFALRSLRRSPTASGFIVATLAVCLAAVAAVYSVADVVLMRGLPFDKPERLLWISSVSRDRPDRPFTLPELMDYRAQTTSVRIAGFTAWSGVVEGRSGAERLQGLRMSADGLAILGAAPSLGRLLAGADDAPGAPHVLMLGYGYWRRELGADPAIIGRALTLNGERFTIVGILPRFLPLPVRDIDAVVPLDPESDPRRNARNSVNFLRVFGRLAPSVTPDIADRELNAVAARLKRRFPTEYAAKIGVRVMSFQEYTAATLRPTVVILVACVALMVAVALANVLNLLLARAVVRQGETAVRLALGASRTRIAIQLLTEGALLVTAAGVIGAAFAQFTISYAASHLTSIAPRIDEARLGLSVLGLVFGICAIAVLLFGLVPIVVARTVSPQSVLRGTGRSGGSSPIQTRLRSSFVVAEVALALVIASATATLLESLVGLERVELGYRPDGVFVARLSLPPKRYRTPTDLARFATSMDAALAGAPGVVAAGASSIAPLSGSQASVPFAPEESAPPNRRDWPMANIRAVSSGYFEAIGVRRVAGRVVADRDDGAAAPIAVVNRMLAERYLGGTGAVGRQLLIDDNDSGARAVTIVGIVDDLREVDLDGPMRPEVFVAMTQVHPDFLSLVTTTQFWAVRVHTEAATFAPTFLRILREVDPTIATAGQTDLRAYVDSAIAPRRFSVGLLAAFAFIALLLTTLGVYSVSAYTVEQRRREIGVRLALGATPSGVMGLMLGRTLRLAGIGVLLGALGAWLASGFMSRLLFGVSPARPATLAAVSALLLCAALAASWLPGRRAANIDALRSLSAD